jgi:predicted ATPase
MTNLFRNGASWLRIDFHLHTRADKRFEYTGKDDYYNSSYIEALKKAEISIGVITNHNKFDFSEFKALRTTAGNKGIFLLPGVELSVNDGSNGIHTLIVFSDKWLENNKDYINQFLNVAFEGKVPPDYEKENGRSTLGLIDTIKKLEGYQKDFFLIFAHVEQSSGLWKELDGGRLQEIGQSEYFKHYTLGFQKVRTNDKLNTKSRVQVKQWIGSSYPAEVEGSDPGSIDDIGKGNPCYIKVGAFTFEAVKFALRAHKSRLRLQKRPEYTHSHIKSIQFEGGTPDGQTVRFSPELNTLIGIRGSGKSSILEALRHGLSIRIAENESDRDYKIKLVEKTLGSGGKVTIEAVDFHGQQYKISRIWKEKANVFVDDKLQPGVSISETILRNPLFFGQKELASAGRGSEKDLIEKLLGSKCDEVRRQISEQKIIVTEAIDKLVKVQNVEELIAEQKSIIANAKHSLTFYEKHKLEGKLQKRLDFDSDIRKTDEGIELVEGFISDLRDLLTDHEDDLRNYPGYTSSYNSEYFKKFDLAFSKIIKSLDTIKSEFAKIETNFSTLNTLKKELLDAKAGLTDEFASIERALADELKTKSRQNISADEFLSLKKKLITAQATLVTLQRSSNQKQTLHTELLRALQKLNDLRHEEFKIIQKELSDVSKKNTALQFSVAFKGDKNAFIEYFKSIYKGSGVRDATFQNIAEKYTDFISIYSDYVNAKKLFGNKPDSFIETFEDNLKTLLTYQTPNKFTIKYRGTELAHHSLGQRASALILFVLGQRENDLIIIDQPEDDLDNQTIYEDVIKLIQTLKPGVQFIFATHNPNIPVLGDAEQVFACTYSDDKISIQAGSLDEPVQQKVIVDIMEGGQEAFDRRKEIYQIWKP